MSDTDTSCYVYTPHGQAHMVSGSMDPHIISFPLPLPQRNTESCQGDGREKPHSLAAQDFSRSGLAQPLTASECGVTFADR